jgi:hypothetical protein
MLRLLKQFQMRNEIQTQRFAARGIVRPAGDLDQAASSVPGSVAGDEVAQIAPPFVFFWAAVGPQISRAYWSRPDSWPICAMNAAARLGPTIW